jgi:hypothetical protein
VFKTAAGRRGQIVLSLSIVSWLEQLSFAKARSLTDFDETLLAFGEKPLK